MFEVILSEGVAKADFIVRRNDECRQVEFARRQRRRIGDLEVSVVAREDLVVLLESAAPMDHAYLESWADRIGVNAELRELR